jgi:flagellar M-ring protein FliF
VALAAILLVGRPLAGRLAIAVAPPPALVAAAAGAPGALPAGAAVAGALPGESGAGLAALPGAEEGAAEAMVGLAKVEGQMRASSLRALAELVEKNPEGTAAVLRRWLAPEER